MDGTRSDVEVARQIIAPWDDGQNDQHFMSDSPWESRGVIPAIQAQIGQIPELGGGMLDIDDSGDRCSSLNNAGAQRQDLGR